MNHFKFNALLQEFSLTKIIGRRNVRDCDGITIKPVTCKIIEGTPHYEGATGSLVNIDNNVEISFILKDGGIIHKAVHNSGYVIHNEAHEDNESWRGETVLEAIHRHNVSATLRYIVRLHDGYKIRNHYSQANYDITIFKSSHSISFSHLIADAKEEAAKQVKAEADF